MRRFYMTLALLSFVALYVVVVAQESCPKITEDALETVDVVCDEMGIDQICYGNVELEIETVDDASDYSFEEPGDTLELSQLQRLQLSPMDEDAGIWGIAMMQLRANVPNTAPGQGVTFLLFGDVSLENREASFTTLPITSTGNINVRSGPSTDFAVVGSLTNGQSINAFGRNQVGDWLKIRLDSDTVGWVYAPLMTMEGDIETLSIVEENGESSSAQAYYFRTGIGDAPCEEAPNSGILVRSPEGIGEVNMTLNGVSVSFGSTLFMQAEPEGDLNVSVLQGHARLKSFDEEQLALVGTKISVPLNDQLEATGPPSLPKPCAAEDLENLPVEHWQCQWVEVQMAAGWERQCPATIPAGMDVLLSLASDTYAEATIDAFIDAADSYMLIDGDHVDVYRSKWDAGDEFGYDTHYYWESPDAGIYTITASNQDQTTSCEVIVLGEE